MTPASARVSVRPPADQVSTQQFAEDVAFYLTQTPRQLPSRYLYDALGSALFEAITRLPWYRVTRAETGLLKTHARAILAACAPLTDTVELGAGSGEKLARVLQARDAGSAELRVHLVDVSRSALSAAAGLLVGLPATQVITHEATYEAGLAEFRRNQAEAGHTLLLFLGSNMGNFDPPQANELLRQIRSALQPGDLFLLGADLLKPERELMLAYDDPLGVTAAFNRNLLVRINRELGADFDLDSFQHRALWNATESRMESYLVSTRTQRIRIAEARLELSMRDGETIWTESSYKYSLDGLFGSLAAAGFARRQAWVDEDAQFALTLVQR
ncbi:L-histidine N(alpha)-methyltransferase [Pseudomonas sp. CC6-YY-74]|uniref:L-histidine N(alpha)-methyltransferase n=1 Tax=Pseudomonas sp. CC6-YY-74 TaxID=1930532 RepID=UPI0009A197F3|nr:L-histidine N(alpha)-methyltransferase [Pseudomonas sp. CC6-YY-74]